MKVLFVEDDIDLNDVTAFALRRHGFTVLPAYSGRQALEYYEQESPDVVVLDISLPELNGMDVLRRIRQRADTPLIMVSGCNDETVMAEAFNDGADDYIVKPFSFLQLALRVRAVSRRVSGRGESNELTVGSLTINPDTWSATCDGRLMSLTRIEFRLLHCLASHAGRVTPSDRLVRFAWRDDGGDANVLKTHISHLRQKLAAAGSTLAISAVPGIGYVLSVDPSENQ